MLIDSLFERDYLNINVLSKLRSYCTASNYDLDVIDLHWHVENIDLINKYLYRGLIWRLLDDVLNNSKCIFLVSSNKHFVHQESHSFFNLDFSK